LPERHSPAEDDHARRLYTIVERAQTFYSGLFWGTGGERARAYMERRGLNEETLRAFGIGYAPAGNGLLRYLEKDGFSEQELQAAGVIGVTEDEGRPYDFFRDRVLFAIRDAQGRPIAFGGRALEDAVTPKYLNSRDTLLFHKQETLFAFDMARKPMAQDRQVVIVEGYMDAAMAHQHGYRNVVATLGTAVTDRHLRLLRRQVDEIVLALDADAAGQAATWRALQQADESLRVGLKPVVAANQRLQRAAPGRWVRLKILALPNAKDPDELIRSDPHAWPTLGIADPIEQDHFINEVAALLGARSDTIRGLLRKTNLPRRPAPSTTSAAPSEVRGETYDDYLLALLMRLRETPGASPAPPAIEFLLPETRALYQALGGPIPPELEPYAQRARRKLDDVRRLSEDELLLRIEHARLEIRKRLLERKRQEISSLGDEVEVRRLMDQLVELAHDIGAIDQQLSPERESAGTR
jgi:DNA primase